MTDATLHGSIFSDMDLFGRGKIMLNGCSLLVIDEADRMLDMGFIPDIEKICTKLPPRRQTLLFSATFPSDIQRLAKTFQQDPIKIEVARPTDAATTITQHVVHLPTNDAKAKRTALRRVIEACDVKNGIVFCNRCCTEREPNKHGARGYVCGVCMSKDVRIVEEPTGRWAI